ncbi:MAG: deoxyribodipyrimidine photo-lyase [Anaerolineae bacterium]|nr:deoxyribodipyrimidine photo-lyase [Anaerolineae bacterium]
MSERVAIWWIRRDLRLHDNLALQAALRSGRRIVPLFILDPALLRGERFGLPRLKFMLTGLQALDDSLRARGGRLIVRHGDPRTILGDLAERTGADAVYANRDYSPYAERRDAAVSGEMAVPVHYFDDALLHAPEHTLKGDGTPFVIYTPYKRHWLTLPKPQPQFYVIGPDVWHDAGESETTLPTLHGLGYGETIPVPDAGEDAAARRLAGFMNTGVFSYRDSRDILAGDPFLYGGDAATSGLSAYLRFGMISPRQMYAAAEEARERTVNTSQRESIDVWISELAWREFYMTILFRFPYAYNTSFRQEFERVAFRHAPDELLAWQEGRTGYPIVDAAMRQLHTTGWMHNRARMIVASFLTKDLLIYWREGDVFFMKHLIDGDPAANNGGWQWSAGTGTDAQPYFRVFNPVTQSQKFDPQGMYIRRWLPQLRGIPDAHIHAPWTMSSPPADYPAPLVDHHAARARALEAFKVVKNG